MADVERTIEVDAPLSTVYNQWTQFEEFPKFMDGVEMVRQIEDDRLYWMAEVGGRSKEWHARITHQEPDRQVAWRSEDGAENAGTVTFESIGPDKTRVMLRMYYEPEDLVDAAGGHLGFMSRRVEGDLKRFKEFIEKRGVETGAWRGRI